MMKIQLPRELEARFAQLRRRLWRVHSLETVLAIFVFLSLSYLVVFTSDRLMDTAAPVRFAVLIGGLVLVGLATLRWIFRWVIKAPGIKYFAVLVQRRYQQLGDRLLGIVELANESARPPDFSEELYEAAIDQVSADALHYDFQAAVSTRLSRRLATTSVALGGVFVILAVLVPGAAVNALARWATPQRDVPRYTLVRISELKPTGVVVHGEAFEVRGQVRYLSFWQPDRVLARFGNEPPMEASISDGEVQVMVPSQHEPREMDVTIGDASDRLAIEPVHRPKLVQVGALAELPRYLGYPDRELRIAGGVLEVLEGSEITLQGEISRELESVTMTLGEERPPESLTVEGATFASGAMNLTNIFEGAFEWRDTLGLSNPEPWQFTIRHAADQAPTIDFPELGFDTAILDTEVLPLRVASRDDFGVNEVGINWRTNEGPQPSAELLEAEFTDGSLDQDQTELDVTFYFSPAIFEVPAGATVEFQGYVTDYFPDRELTETPVYRIHIVSSAEHAELIRTRLESLLTNLEEISRLQEKLAAATEELQNNPDLDPAAIESRLQDQMDDQAMNAAMLAQLAQEGLETLREAMRNAQFTDEMMEQWTETMSEMQSLAQQKMSEASQSLSKAQKSPKARSENLSKAQQTQEEILEALEQMQQNVNEDLDQMEAMTLAQRLRSLGNQEVAIEEALMEQAAATIGLFDEELAPRFQAMNERLAETQTETSTASKEIQEEISRFFERSEREAYGEVSKSMKESGVVEELLEVRELIKENVSMRATELLADWGKKFEDWADVLEPEPSDDPSSGSGGGGGGEDQMDLTKHLMALLRLRESEFTLRVKTRLLDAKRDNEPLHTAQSSELADTQVGIQERLGDVLLENPLPDLDGVLDEAHVEMDSVIEKLKVRDTGEETVEGETRTINTITDAINLINEQAQRQGSSSSSQQQQMAMMMQMANMGKGQAMSQNPSGSGSQAGGDTDQTGDGQQGESSGEADDARSIARGGASLDDLPSEFRNVFEQYYKRIEALEATLPMPAAPNPVEDNSR